MGFSDEDDPISLAGDTRYNDGRSAIPATLLHIHEKKGTIELKTQKRGLNGKEN